MEIKLCECGCGQKTKIFKRTNLKDGHIKGQSARFIRGHNHWNGGRIKNSNGYIKIMQKDHPRAGRSGYVNEAILVIEKVLGHYFPLKAVVHHVDGIPSNNVPNNLVACEDNSYHFFLHARKRAFENTGDPRKRPCGYCCEYDSLENLKQRGSSYYHLKCRSIYDYNYWRLRKKEKEKILRRNYEQINKEGL